MADTAEFDFGSAPSPTREAGPHHVTRIDIQPSEKYPRRHPTHGWQVRVRRDGERQTKFFADARHGGVEGAMAAAVAYRDELLAQAPTTEPRPRKAWSNTGVVGLSVREKLEAGQQKPYVQLNWVSADGKRHAASYSVAKWGLRRALWNGCLRLYRERKAAGAPVEEAHEMFARAQEPFVAEIRAEQRAETKRQREAEAVVEAEAHFQSPEAVAAREAEALRRLESQLFGG